MSPGPISLTSSPTVSRIPATQHEAELLALMGMEAVGCAGLELGADELHVLAGHHFSATPGCLKARVPRLPS